MMRLLHAAIAVMTILALVPEARAQADRDVSQTAASARETADRLRRAAIALERAQRFRVVLIVSSTVADPPTENIPADARKALEDMKAFLPFKSYRLFGTGEVQAQRGSPATLRISGGDNQTFEVTIARDTPPLVYSAEAMRAKIWGHGNGPRSNPPASPLSLTFMLRDISSVSPAQPVVVSQASINTLVAMDVGETIVVGTSRVGGSRGMLALLTALPTPGK